MGPEGTAWSCVRGGLGGQGMGLHQRVVGTEHPQGSGHIPALTEFKKHLDNTLRLGGPAWRQGLDSMILMGPF